MIDRQNHLIDEVCMHAAMDPRSNPIFCGP